MTLKIAVQLDPIHKLNPKGDSSLALAWGAQQKGHQVYSYQPENLNYHDGRLYAGLSTLSITKQDDAFFPKEDYEGTQALNSFDVILIRQDPPYDMAYITNTYLLEHISKKTLVLNHPKGIRNAAEKLLPLYFQEFLPATLITQSLDEISEFSNQHGDIIIKPLYDYGGHSVFRYKAGDGQLRSLLDLLQKSYPKLPFIIQPFLEEVVEGDKRIILFDGEIIGGFRRVPEKGEVRANMLMGGKPVKYEVSDSDLNICKALKDTFRHMGLFFVGLDIIGDKLIEINVTSPTGLIPLNQLNGIDSESIFWDKVETIVDNRDKNGRQYYNSIFPGN